MDSIFSKIQDLLMSRDTTNIRLALEIAKGQGISEEEVWRPWMELIELCRISPEESLETIFERVLRKNLELSESNLEYLPTQLKELRTLLSLNIRKNNLTEIPEWIGNLKNLTSLVATHNSIQTLPASFTKLQQLRVLNLENNALHALPESFGLLESLQELCLHHNPLMYIPESFGQLQKLELLDLPACAILAIPNSIQNLRRLKEIYINDYTQFIKENSLLIKDQSKQKIHTIRRMLPRCLITF